LFAVDVDESTNFGHIASMQQRPLSSTREVMDALGGYKAVAAMFGLEPTATHNWIKSQFPAGTLKVMTEELSRHGLTADPSLWRMRKRISEAAETNSTEIGKRQHTAA
jgi:hypothetical protein